MLWVYGHYKYFSSFSVEIVSSCQNLMSTVFKHPDVQMCRLKLTPVELLVFIFHSFKVIFNEK